MTAPRYLEVGTPNGADPFSCVVYSEYNCENL
jgi:hypothetical protein